MSWNTENITVEVPFDDALAGEPVRLLLEGLERGRESSALRIFVDEPDADAETPIEGNPHYAGTVYLYGHGQSAPEEEKFPARAARQRQPYDQSLDVTALLENLAIAGGTLAVTVVPVDLQDRPVDVALVKFRRLVLISGE